MTPLEKYKQQLQQSLYKLALLSFVVVIIWIAFEIYYSYTKNKSQPKPQAVAAIRPISPNLHLDLAQTLARRRTLTSTELQNFRSIARSNAIYLQQQPEDQDPFSQPDLEYDYLGLPTSPATSSSSFVSSPSASLFPTNSLSNP